MLLRFLQFLFQKFYFCSELFVIQLVQAQLVSQIAYRIPVLQFVDGAIILERIESLYAVAAELQMLARWGSLGRAERTQHLRGLLQRV